MANFLRVRGPTTPGTRQRDLPGRWEPHGVHRAPETFFHDIYLLKKTPDASLELSHKEIVDLAYKGLGLPEGSLTGFSQADKRKVTLRTTVDMVPGKDRGGIQIRPDLITASALPVRESRITWVHVHDAEIKWAEDDILTQLEKFGSVTTSCQELVINDPDSPARGMWAGSRRVGMRIVHDIPTFAWINEARVRIVYSGQKRRCTWCGLAAKEPVLDGTHYGCWGETNARRCQELGARKGDLRLVWEIIKARAEGNIIGQDTVLIKYRDQQRAIREDLLRTGQYNSPDEVNTSDSHIFPDGLAGFPVLEEQQRETTDTEPMTDGLPEWIQQRRRRNRRRTQSRKSSVRQTDTDTDALEEDQPFGEDTEKTDETSEDERRGTTEELFDQLVGKKVTREAIRKARESEEVVFSQIPVHLGVDATHIKKWIMDTLNCDDGEDDIGNPRPRWVIKPLKDKPKCWIILNTNEAQRIRVFSATKKAIWGRPFRARPATEDDIYEDKEDTTAALLADTPVRTPARPAITPAEIDRINALQLPGLEKSPPPVNTNLTSTAQIPMESELPGAVEVVADRAGGSRDDSFIKKVVTKKRKRTGSLSASMILAGLEDSLEDTSGQDALSTSWAEVVAGPPGHTPGPNGAVRPSGAVRVVLEPSSPRVNIQDSEMEVDTGSSRDGPPVDSMMDYSLGAMGQSDLSSMGPAGKTSTTSVNNGKNFPQRITPKHAASPQNPQKSNCLTPKEKKTGLPTFTFTKNLKKPKIENDSSHPPTKKAKGKNKEV